MNLIKIESVLREYPVSEAICNNPSATAEQKKKVIDIVKQIELSLGVLTPVELEIINLRYFNHISNKDVAKKLNVTEQTICKKTKNILNKINKIMVL
ncbi:sigma-70 family RNA polymerase sigma factor [Clostridium combesii]|uniref:sigma-70 family RNA polymerase sigma factor n=1 Tax=Clostridium combesii TaxID=39481 RepID=UPI0013FDA1AC|nr:sigma-70 family RNA polymerase sigma factor [Clostridium combesii]